MSLVFKLTDLQQRREPKRKKDFLISYTSTIDKKEESDESKESKEPKESDESDESKEKKHVIRFLDDRNRTLVDRDVILKRLHRPVESKKISQAPILEEGSQEPLSKKKRGQEQKGEKEKEEAEETEEEDKDKDKEIEEEDRGQQIGEKESEQQLEEAVTSIIETEEENQPTEKQPTGKNVVKKSKKGIDIGRVDLSIAKIGDQLIKDRLPPTSKYSVPVSSYYMNNRKIYISKLAQLFKPYSDKIATKSANLSCKTLHSQNVDFELLTHQLVVRDYLNLYTPYRGLLLYHGLGSGKTCTSIGIAEGMKSGKQIVLMTPASLKMNFFNELKKCGDILYKKSQYWEFISIEGDIQRAALLSTALGLDIEYIRSHKGAWLMNVKKESNFADLSDSDQKSVDQQIDHMIRNKYIDINYNGLQKKHLDEMTKNGKINPFDNKVVIVDEAHNLVSNIANSGNKKGTKAYMLYRSLMDATNAKIIFLTGTPMINTPREIAILFNMLRGYIKTWTFILETTTSDKINTEIITDDFREDGLTTYDFVEYTTNKLVVTRNPFGFVNIYKKGKGKRGGRKTGDRKTRDIRKPKKINTRKKRQEIYDDDYDSERNKEYNRLDTELYEGGGAIDEYAGVHLDEHGNISDHIFESRLINILILITTDYKKNIWMK